MRITNNMIRSNTMLHIQKNKETANDYFQQYASQKKNTETFRQSDDCRTCSEISYDTRRNKSVSFQLRTGRKLDGCDRGTIEKKRTIFWIQ